MPENVYHIYTVADFQKMVPDFDFAAYFKDIKVGNSRLSTLPLPTSSRR